MANEKALMDVFTKIEGDVNGVIATAVVDLESGMTLAAKTNRPEFDLAVASAYNSELVKQKMKIMRALNLKSTLEDMLLTLSDQFHLIKFLPGGTSFLYLAVDRAGTNLAIVRNSVAKHVQALALKRAPPWRRSTHEVTLSWCASSTTVRPWPARAPAFVHSGEVWEAKCFRPLKSVGARCTSTGWTTRAVCSRVTGSGVRSSACPASARWALGGVA